MIRFYNGRAVTMAGPLRAEDLEVWTDGGNIAYVGPKKDDGTVFEREIDMRGGVLLPGFKDAHTHSAMTFLRSFADDEPLDAMRLIKYYGKAGCAYFAPRWDNLLVTRDVVEAAHANGMKVCVWAVDDAGLALEALRRGVDYVMSNRPNGLYADMLAAQRD